MIIYDIIIIGSGPAGVAAAKLASSKGLSVLIIDRGKGIGKRRDITSGWFGRGLFSLDRIESDDPMLANKRATNEVLRLAKSIAPGKIKPIKVNGKVKMYKTPANFGVELAQYFYHSVSQNADIALNTDINNIEFKNGVFCAKGYKKEFFGYKCIIATGRNSIDWVRALCNAFNIKTIKNSIKIGVRIEVPTFKVGGVLSDTGDISLNCGDMETSDTIVNSFVGEWEDSNLLSALGHHIPEKRSVKTSFMLGKEVGNSEDAIRDVKIANILADDKVKVERVKDYFTGRSVLRHIRTFASLGTALGELDGALPQLMDYAIMHVPEIKLRGILPVDLNMKTEVKGLYGVGECTSMVSTLTGAMASGFIAARTVLEE